MSEAENFVRDLASCQSCRKFPTSSTLEKWEFQKPSVQFKTYSAWKPPYVKVLFLAESAPGTSEGYFYDPEPNDDYGENLRTGLFQLLTINHPLVADSLKEFRDQGYFLSDGVKCRCDKGDRSHPPSILAENCGQTWLGREIDVLNPDKICTLGNTALEALGVVRGYEKAATAKAGRDCGTILEAKRPVLVWVFPSDRTSNYAKGKENVFYKFTRK
jgi:hypothetical protein